MCSHDMQTHCKAEDQAALMDYIAGFRQGIGHSYAVDGAFGNGLGVVPQRMYRREYHNQGKVRDEVRFGRRNQNRFRILHAFRHFMSGVISPVTAIFKHPAATLGLVGATVALGTLMSSTVPLMFIAGGMFSAWQMARGLTHIAGRYRKNDMQGAEQAFADIGAAFTGGLLTLLGVRSAAAVAAETKAASLIAMKPGTTVVEMANAGLQAAKNTRNMTFWQALNENMSIVTSSEGRQALFHQIKPGSLRLQFSSAKARIVDTWEALKSWNRFRRMTDAQLADELHAVGQSIFQDARLPGELLPKFKPDVQGTYITRCMLMAYIPKEHAVLFNPALIRRNPSLIADCISHELLHARRALLRCTLTESEIQQVVNTRILRQILEYEDHLGVIQPTPRFSKDMRHELVNHLADVLYNPKQTTWWQWGDDIKELGMPLTELLARKSGASSDEIAGWLASPDGANRFMQLYQQVAGPTADKFLELVHRYPGFQKQYANGIKSLSSEEQAVLALDGYFRSQLHRAIQTVKNIKMPEFVSQAYQRNISRIPAAGKASAMKSAAEFMEAGEALNRLNFMQSLRLVSPETANQYFFAREEVMARNASALWRIKQVKNRLNQPDHQQYSRVRRLVSQQEVYRTELKINALGNKKARLERLLARQSDKAEAARINAKIHSINTRLETLMSLPSCVMSPAMPFYLAGKYTAQWSVRQFPGMFLPDIPAPVYWNPAFAPRVGDTDPS